MDDCRFDNWTRMVSGQADRRTVVAGIAGGVAALLTLARAELGLAQEGELGIEGNCKINSAKCNKDRECCSKRCQKKKRGRKGKCICASQGRGCKRDEGCCSGICKDGKCQCGLKGDGCRKNGDCCSNICKNDNKCDCIKQGNRCDRGNQCCSGRCNDSGFCT